MTTKFSSAQKLLSVSDVVKHFGVGHQTIRKWIRNGELLSIRVGGSIRIRAEDLDAFVKSNERQRATVSA